MTLTVTRDHCRTMADNPATSTSDRRLWTQIADEIDAYIGVDDDTEALFEDADATA